MSTLTAGMVRFLLGPSNPLLPLLAGPDLPVDGQRVPDSIRLILRLGANGTDPSEPVTTAARDGLDRVSVLLGAGAGRDIAVRDVLVPGGAGPLPARAYLPPRPSGGLLVFFHGGGWVRGSIRSHDALCRVLARYSGSHVVSVAYRLAPEHPFPAAVDDAYAAYAHLARTARTGYGARRVAVGGDSAGGNLAAAVAHRFAAEAEIRPCHTLLVYPGIDSDIRRYASQNRLGEQDLLLTTASVDAFIEAYCPDPALRTDPRFSVIGDDRLTGLPPTHVVTAGIDPLRDQGLAYVQRLRGAGTDVEHTDFPGLPHGFANLLAAPEAYRAVVALAGRLRAALA
ncbi:alpha/beta hydrolase [Nocardiopsis ansamitocini]|uniref:Alpha/beta hydrolase n=1 Tax=Nocardiopsis ansamitocini TaxID=1670832 RepID=A0A9W6P5U5_9ACTN|nr:alpha/beta hydrolase [Nocardiopsis ansamitocini]GLU47696.1 alpha/beta hydrolase [Nocardiopsis ansamitocini]